ncbi:MAG: CBS domain-containing protein [Candidatus Omnitrophica bacterium]|nr:CBS domain-containing protein [Candidatus Omnitrophota bacterium]
MKLRDILKIKGSKVWTVREDQTLLDAIHILVNQKIGALLIFNKKNRLVGIISERDMMNACYAHSKELGIIPVSDWMTEKVIIGSPEDDVKDIMAIMTEKRVRHIPVMVENELQGIVSIGDIVKSLLQDTAHEIQYLKEFMYGSAPEGL